MDPVMKRLIHRLRLSFQSLDAHAWDGLDLPLLLEQLEELGQVRNELETLTLWLMDEPMRKYHEGFVSELFSEADVIPLRKAA